METERRRTFKWIYVAIAVVLVLVTIFALLFAMQEHKDRVLSEEINEAASELQETGARITSIRDADMKDMNDYIRAFSEIRPLLGRYDGDLQRITDLYNQARERYKRLRGVEGPPFHELGKHVGDSGYRLGVGQSHEAVGFDHSEYGSTPGSGTSAVLARTVLATRSTGKGTTRQVADRRPTNGAGRAIACNCFLNLVPPEYAGLQGAFRFIWHAIRQTSEF